MSPITSGRIGQCVIACCAVCRMENSRCVSCCAGSPKRRKQKARNLGSRLSRCGISGAGMANPVRATRTARRGLCEPCLSDGIGLGRAALAISANAQKLRVNAAAGAFVEVSHGLGRLADCGRSLAPNKFGPNAVPVARPQVPSPENLERIPLNADRLLWLHSLAACQALVKVLLIDANLFGQRFSVKCGEMHSPMLANR